MWIALIYALAITLIGAFLFTVVEWYEPNPRLATVFKIAILAAGAAAIANRFLPRRAACGHDRYGSINFCEFAKHFCAAEGERVFGGGDGADAIHKSNGRGLLARSNKQ